MNSNWGLVEPLSERVRDKREKRLRLAERALVDFVDWLARSGVEPAVDPSALRPAQADSAPPSDAPAHPAAPSEAPAR
jgi:hypothetical protein